MSEPVLGRHGQKLAAALARSGFLGADSWYMNSAANTAYAARARDAGKLALPVLFLHGAYDFTCETIDSRLAEPMRRDCADLTDGILRPLDGPGATNRSQCGSGEMDRRKNARCLANPRCARKSLKKVRVESPRARRQA
jgi:hypothetical protein